jgi:hypothetical protein
MPMLAATCLAATLVGYSDRFERHTTQHDTRKQTTAQHDCMLSVTFT